MLVTAIINVTESSHLRISPHQPRHLSLDKSCKALSDVNQSGAQETDRVLDYHSQSQAKVDLHNVVKTHYDSVLRDSLALVAHNICDGVC